MKYTFKIKSKLWRYPSANSSWFFVTVDKKISERIKVLVDPSNGWGQIRVEVELGNSKWLISLFPSKGGEYIFALKKLYEKQKILRKEIWLACLSQIFNPFSYSFFYHFPLNGLCAV